MQQKNEQQKLIFWTLSILIKKVCPMSSISANEPVSHGQYIKNIIWKRELKFIKGFK